MPYQPYRTIPRDYNEKSGSLSGVSVYPLVLPTYSAPAPAPPFNPASLTAPLITWFGKQDSDIGYTMGTPTSWVNQGTNGGSATLTDCVAGSVNGRDVIDFYNPGFSNGEYTQDFTGQARAVYIACKVTTDIPNASPTNIPFTQQGTGINGEFGTYIFCPTAGVNEWQYFFIAQAVSIPILSSVVTSYNPLNVSSVFSFVNSATSTSNNRIGINNTSLGLDLNDLAAGYYIGPVTTYLNGLSPKHTWALYEMLVYDGEVSPTESTQVVNYLKTKWAI